MCISVQNGVHADSLGPSTITRWAEFLKLYVANEIPVVPPRCSRSAARSTATSRTPPAAPVQQSRFAGMTDVAAAKAIFERDPHVRVLMDNGGGPQGPGSIGATWELGFGSWPPKEAKADPLLPRPGRRARSQAGEGLVGRVHRRPEGPPAPDAAGRRRGGRLEGAAALQLGAGRGRQGARLRDRRAGERHRDRRPVEPRRLPQVLGPDTDLQVTLSEVRPDGNETYVQNGWLRASHRKLDARRSTPFDPFPTHLQAGRGAAAARAGSRWCGCRSSRSPTPSAPARGSG